MSQVSVLSQEYKTASELSHTINTFVIDLTKARRRVPYSGADGEDGLIAERTHVAEILITLAGLLDPDNSQVLNGHSASEVSGALVARLREEKSGELASYVADLRETASRLSENPCLLTDAHLAILDRLAAVASAETSRVYRRLMRK
jgi:hypothetical protein